MNLKNILKLVNFGKIIVFTPQKYKNIPFIFINMTDFCFYSRTILLYFPNVAGKKMYTMRKKCHWYILR